MANVVEILIKARDDASKALDRVGGRLDNLADRARRARGPLLAVAAATAGIGIAGVKMAADFETALAEVRTLLPNLDQGGLEQLRKGILDFSKELGIATNQSVPALYQAISAGVPADNVLDFMRTAAKASIGGVTELETAVDGITSVVNAYGASVLNAGEASDLMFTAVRLGKTTFDELSRSLFNVIPTAASLDISFAEVAAAMATMTAQGVPTRVATTNLRQAFVEASKTGSNLDKAIRELAGTGLAQLTKEGNTAFSVFNNLRKSMPEQAFRDLFGSVEALNAVLLITGPQADNMQRTMDEMASATGAADAAFEVIADTAGFKLKRAMVGVQVALIEIGDIVMPAVLRIVEVVGKLTQKFADLSRPVKTAIVVMGGVALALAAIGLAIPPIIAAFGLLLSPVALVGIAIGALVAGALLALTRWREGTKKVIAAVIDAFFAVPIFVGKAFEAAINVVIDSLNKLLEVAEDTFNKISPLGDVAFARISRFQNEMIGTLEAARDAVQDWVSNGIDVAGKAVEDFTAQFQEMVDKVKGLVPVAKAAANALDDLGEDLPIDEMNELTKATQRAAREIAALANLSQRGFKAGVTAAGAHASVGFTVADVAAHASRFDISLAEAQKAIMERLFLPSLAQGGVVPGSVGRAQLIVAHGGETITPAGQSGDTIITFGDIIIQGNADDPAEVARQVVDALDEQLGRAALFDESVRGS